MGDTIQIRRLTDGRVFEGPAGTAIPEGFEQVGGSTSTTTDSRGLAGSLYDALRSVGQGYRDYVAKPATDAVNSAVAPALNLLPFAQGQGTQNAIDNMGQLVVPQTATGAGIVAGSLASMGLGTLPMIMGATAGGLIGGGLEGTPNTGAATGALAGTLSAAGTYPLSAGRRALFQQGADETAVGRAIGDISPTLGAQPDAAAIQARLKGATGKQDLSAAYQAVRDRVAGVMQGQPGYGAAQGGMEGGVLSSNTITAPAGGALEQLTGKQAMTFDEAASAIEDLRAGRHPLTGALVGSQKGAVERALKAQAVQELSQSLDLVDPALGTLFKDAERSYGSGQELIRLFRQKGVLDPQVQGLNMPKLQQLAGEQQGQLERMLGPAGWATLQRAIYRGGVPPGMDLPGYQLPMIRAYPGAGMSAGETLPLTPTRYIGPDQLSVPPQLMLPAVTNFVDRHLNPYRR